MRVPSGLNATAFTAPSWPVVVARSVARCLASHSRTVLSALPEAMRVPSGLNATLVTASLWRSGCPIGCPVVGVPQPDGVVGAAGGDAGAVGAERHAGHRVIVV